MNRLRTGDNTVISAIRYFTVLLLLFVAAKGGAQTNPPAASGVTLKMTTFMSYRSLWRQVGRRQLV